MVKAIINNNSIYPVAGESVEKSVNHQRKIKIINFIKSFLADSISKGIDIAWNDESAKLDAKFVHVEGDFIRKELEISSLSLEERTMILDFLRKEVMTQTKMEEIAKEQFLRHIFSDFNFIEP